MKRLMIFLLLLPACFPLVAQHTIAALPWATQDSVVAGLNLDDPAYERTKLASPPDSKAVIPNQMDLSPYCPEVRNQGPVQSCVGWAAGYGALTIEEAIRREVTDRSKITANAFSALFVYNQIKLGDCRGAGARLSDALVLLQEQGNCLARDFDEDVTDCSRLPDEEQLRWAEQYKVAGYERLFPVNAAPELKVNRVRHALAARKPVIIGLEVRRNFYLLHNARYWWPQAGNTNPAGGHALVVVGYDDREEAFLLFNSWGKNWGSNGFIRIKYRQFADFCHYAYILRISNEPSPLAGVAAGRSAGREPEATGRSQQLAGSVELRYNQQRNSSDFRTASIQLQKVTYQPQPNNWKLGQQFQLEITNEGDRPAYVYALSIDSRDQVSIHWPAREQSAALASYHKENAPLQKGGMGRLVLPAENRVFTKAEPGKDLLIVLFCSHPLEGVENLADDLQRGPGDMLMRLFRWLEPQLIPRPDVTFAEQQIGFQSNTFSGKNVVPVLIEINSF